MSISSDFVFKTKRYAENDGYSSKYDSLNTAIIS